MSDEVKDILLQTARRKLSLAQSNPSYANWINAAKAFERAGDRDRSTTCRLSANLYSCTDEQQKEIDNESDD
jgi:hypothetical protein